MKQLLTIFLALSMFSCQQPANREAIARVPVDSVGFATEAWQMDSVIHRIEAQFTVESDSPGNQDVMDLETFWKVAVSPHDDYTYAGPLYPLAIRPLKAGTVFLVGVAHKARQLGLENSMVFDSYTAWQGPYGPVGISGAREELIDRLPAGAFTVSDSMHAVEHSLEALVPFLQYYNRKVEIIPILVPYMDFQRMDSLADMLAGAIFEIAAEKGWEWGTDYALLISNDAVHYGDEDWGGRSYARYGADSAGYEKAVMYEHEIIDSCLTGSLEADKLHAFTRRTVQDTDYHEYRWTWCGRYAVPFGLLTGVHLQQKFGEPPLQGTLLGYLTSIDHPVMPVDDLGMGVTAPATIRHWVGYAAIGYH